MKPLVIVGPTGAGKSAIAQEIAEEHGATIVSMDAMQVYRGFDIGTAKTTAAERARVPHACIDVRDADETFSAADFVAEATRIEASGVPMLLVGGTTFYLRAWLFGLVDAPPVDAQLRARLEALADPHAALLAVDPVLAARLHPNDRVRLVRGLEIYALTGRRLSEMHDADPWNRRDAELVCIDSPDLYTRIDARVDAMMQAGYLREVEELLRAGVSPDCKPMQSLGYRHLTAHVRGGVALAEAVRLTKRDTRHFARKQRGFLRSWEILPSADPVGDALAAAHRAFGSGP